MKCFLSYKISLFFNNSIEKYPNIILNILPLTRHNNTLTIVESNGVISGIIVNNNIPIHNDIIIDNHALCLDIILTWIKTNLSTTQSTMQ